MHLQNCLNIQIIIFYINNLMNLRLKPYKSGSKRQDNWKKYPYLFNSCKNLVFECQCGKKYESFPGLYLHFQRKHDQKISTKFNPDQCLILKEEQKITYKYMLQEKRTDEDLQINVEKSFSEKSEISNVLQKFIIEINESQANGKFSPDQASQIKQMEEIVRRFEKYILQQMEQNPDQQGQNSSCSSIVNEIPNYFNAFVCSFLIIQDSTQYWKICSILFQMYQWLKKQGYTQLIVEFIQKPPIQV